MTARRLAVVLTSLLALGIAVLSSAAIPGRNTPVRGVVIGISSESMEVQTDTGAVTVAITDKTRVIRTVSGTIADLHRGQIVELTLNTRGRVAQLHIKLPGTKLGPPPNPGRSQTRNRGPALIRSVSARTIRVRFANDRLITYRLVSKPKVIKDLAGRLRDVAIGQTVLVTRSHGGRIAELIVILRG
jgi:hypothetical protein